MSQSFPINIYTGYFDGLGFKFRNFFTEFGFVKSHTGHLGSLKGPSERFLGVASVCSRSEAEALRAGPGMMVSICLAD